MDITPQVINEVEFHQKMRGYDPDEVDDFLERVAVAVGTLHDRLQEAADRVAQAERQAAEVEQTRRSAPAPAAAPVAGEDDTDTIRRTLVLAQRTADAAIKEAEETAQRTIASAQEQADQLYHEAQEHAQKVVANAEAEARRSADDTRQRLVAEIITLEQTRDSLRADHGLLEQHVDEQRTRVRAAIADLERLLEDPSRLREAAAPALSEATMPEFVDTAPAASPEAPVVEPDPPVVEPAAEPTPMVDLADEPPFEPVAWEAPDVPEAPAEPITGSVTFSPPEAAESAPPGPVTSTVAEDEAWARFVGDEGGPPTEAIRLDDAGDDAYLAELRKAMLDDSGEELLPTDDPRRQRFGRRR